MKFAEEKLDFFIFYAKFSKIHQKWLKMKKSQLQAEPSMSKIWN